MVKAHSPINWQNKPSVNTPINETNLNKMDSTIGILDDRIIAHDTSKLDKSTANTMVKDVTYNESTGIFTITYLNGSTKTLDTKLEKIATNFKYDYSKQTLILTLIDGTTQSIDMSALLTQYEFTDSATLDFSVDSSGKITATIKNGSITEDKLQPNFLADIKVETAKSKTYMDNASASAENANASAVQSQSYAIGGTGTRDNEDADNAKYYKEQAQAAGNAVPTYLSQIAAAGKSQLSRIQDALNEATVNFQVDLSTGHLMYSGCEEFVFNVNQTNGHLEWRLA